eukprot:TRINITY_DN12327_c0_g3_i1.p1 TRINITY_DN12327_c0_g3~~TRINITY_DN12327_c0_g3_i1.p1  ORF type:complete len:1434 (+),score=307.41 TRINITY_DN12327_c0_g3_i1:84-4304(+)
MLLAVLQVMCSACWQYAYCENSDCFHDTDCQDCSSTSGYSFVGLVDNSYCWEKAECRRPCPTARPTTSRPTRAPTRFPVPTAGPTQPPTVSPTVAQPSASPTAPPTVGPTRSPTRSPTGMPSAPPTEPPTKLPTRHPSAFPTAPPTAPPTEPLDECSAQCPSCAGATCSAAGQRCSDPDTLPAATGDWACECVPPLRGTGAAAAAACTLDECIETCATCQSASPCDAATQDCHDPDTSTASTGDWTCTCRPPAASWGRAGPPAGGCLYDECQQHAAVCEARAQHCHDPDRAPSSLGDWQCACLSPATNAGTLSGRATAAAAACIYPSECEHNVDPDLCGANEAACRPHHGKRPRDICVRRGQVCADADGWDIVNAGGVNGNWECQCPAPAVGVSGNASAMGPVPRCELDECAAVCPTCERSDPSDGVGICASQNQVCRDDITDIEDSRSHGSWACGCVPPQHGAGGPGDRGWNRTHRTTCYIDECLADCPVCAGSRCRDAGLECVDTDKAPGALGSWVCVCPAPSKGSASRWAAPCTLDECAAGAASTCAAAGQTCVDAKQSYDALAGGPLGDWECRCPAPHLGFAVGAVAPCLDPSRSPSSPPRPAPSSSPSAPPSRGPLSSPPSAAPSAGPSHLILECAGVAGGTAPCSVTEQCLSPGCRGAACVAELDPDGTPCAVSGSAGSCRGGSCLPASSAAPPDAERAVRLAPGNSTLRAHQLRGKAPLVVVLEAVSDSFRSLGGVDLLCGLWGDSAAAVWLNGTRSQVAEACSVRLVSGSRMLLSFRPTPAMVPAETESVSVTLRPALMASGRAAPVSTEQVVLLEEQFGTEVAVAGAPPVLPKAGVLVVITRTCGGPIDAAPEETGETLGPMYNPLMLSMGSGNWSSYNGALVGDTLLFGGMGGGCFLLHMVLIVAVRRRAAQRGSEPPGGARLAEAARFGCLVAPLTMLYPIWVMVAATVWQYGDSGRFRVYAGATLLFCTALPAFIWRAVRRADHYAVCNKTQLDPRCFRFPAGGWFFAGGAEWAPMREDCKPWFRLTHLFFAPFTYRDRYFLAADLLWVLCVSMVQAWRPQTESHCETQAVACLALLVTRALYVTWRRVYISPFDNAIDITVGWLEVATKLLLMLDDPAEPGAMTDAANGISDVCGAVLVVLACLTLWSFFAAEYAHWLAQSGGDRPGPAASLGGFAAYWFCFCGVVDAVFRAHDAQAVTMADMEALVCPRVVPGLEVPASPAHLRPLTEQHSSNTVQHSNKVQHSNTVQHNFTPANAIPGLQVSGVHVAPRPFERSLSSSTAVASPGLEFCAKYNYLRPFEKSLSNITPTDATPGLTFSVGSDGSISLDRAASSGSAGSAARGIPVRVMPATASSRRSSAPLRPPRRPVGSPTQALAVSRAISAPLRISTHTI